MKSGFWKLAAAAVAATAAATTVGTGAARAQMAEPNPQMVSLGQRIWKEKTACNDCHGWSGNGVPDDSRQPTGANLRQTKLSQEQLIEVIKCGRPGTGMPHFDQRAYEDDRCYGLKAADLGPAKPPFLGTGLIPREIQAVVAFLEAKVIGRGPFTRNDCHDFFGQNANVCNTFTYGAGLQPPLPPGTVPLRGDVAPH